MKELTEPVKSQEARDIEAWEIAQKIHIGEAIPKRDQRDLRSDLFFRYWTLKESFLKATGLGMKLPMDEFQIRLGTDIDVIQSVDSRRYTFREYDDLPGCRCALCAAGDCRDTELRIVDLKKILAKER